MMYSWFQPVVDMSWDNQEINRLREDYVKHLDS
jgi:hypothetical protein